MSRRNHQGRREGRRALALGLALLACGEPIGSVDDDGAEGSSGGAQGSGEAEDGDDAGSGSRGAASANVNLICLIV